MTNDVTIHLWGDGGCFVRPDVPDARVSYEVIPPSAIRGILQRVYSHPAVRWVADSVLVLNPIQLKTLLLDDPGPEPPPGAWGNVLQAGVYAPPETEEEYRQRQATVTLGTNYIVQVHLELTPLAADDESVTAHLDAFRKIARGLQRIWPHFGVRPFRVSYSLIESEDDPEPYQDSSFYDTEVDLGWMPCDVPAGESPRWFRARMIDGFIAIPPWQEGVLRPDGDA